MKRKDLLLLTALLIQTVPVWAMYNDADELEMRNRSHGQTRTHVHFREFVPSLPLTFNTLNPSDPLPANLGMARQRVSCTFGNNAPIEIILPTEYPLQGQWVFQEDLDNTQNRATLKLSTRINNEWKNVTQLDVNIQHQLVSEDPEVPGWNYFDGDQVYQARTKLQRWRNPQTGRVYSRTLARQDNAIPTHQGSQVVYVEPFALGDTPSKPKDAYRGSYHTARELADHEELPGKKVGSLLYSDGNNIYYPHITQELWEQDNSQAGFFIASYRQDKRLNFIPGTAIQGGQLPEGLYQLLSVQDGNRRTERWQRLGDNPAVIEITAPGVFSSIPGMGAFAPRVVPHNNAMPQILTLQDNLERSDRRMQDIRQYIGDHPNAEGSVVILGPTGSGKTILAHILAERQLRSTRIPHKGCRLDTDNPLPGFVIGHGGQAGTTFPAVWFDQHHNLLLADCPGFGDPEGAEQDILNAFSIHNLLKNRGNVKIVVAVKEGDITGRATHFIKLLNDITGVFQNDQDLQRNLSFVVTHQLDTQPNEFCPLLAQTVNDTPQLSLRSRNLLRFLAQNQNRVSSIPKAPQHEGPFNFNSHLVRRGVEDSTYVVNPQARIAVGPNAQLLVGQLATGLNEYLTNYMKTEGSQRVINHCMKRVDDYQGSIENLRLQFTNLIPALQALQQVPAHSPIRFADGLRNIMDVTDIEKTIQHIGFLKTLKNDIIYHTNDWSNALLETINKVRILSAPPQVEFVNGNLTVKGTLVGMSEVLNAARQRPALNSINVFGLNMLLIDSDFVSPGTSCSFIAPFWKIVGNHIFNLSGTLGGKGDDGQVAGTNGKPGKPGGNGGHFYGKGFIFKNLSQLTVNTNGGQGGKGGNGAQGANGANGQDGDLSIRRYTGDSDHRNKQAHRKNFIHDARGTDGTPGFNGGKRGAGGFGGYSGEVIINENLFNYVAQIGAIGTDGLPGEGGKGGKHGEHCQGNDQEEWWHPRQGWVCEGRTTTNIYGAPLTPIKHVTRNPTHAANGTPGVGLNTIGQQQPTPQIPFNSAPLVLTYKAYYQQQAASPNVAPFIKVFPNL